MIPRLLHRKEKYDNNHTIDMPQNGDRRMASKEANEKIPHFQAEGGEKPMVCDYLYSSFRKIFCYYLACFLFDTGKVPKRPLK